MTEMCLKASYGSVGLDIEERERERERERDRGAREREREEREIFNSKANLNILLPGE